MSDTITVNTSTENINIMVDTGGSVRWGTINGTLSTQTDLWNVLSGGGTGDIGVNTLVHLNSGYWNTAYSSTTALNLSSVFWNSVYTTVQNNSATAWNYQGTDIKALTANWQGTYSTVTGLSGNWNKAYTVATEYQSISGTYATTTALNAASGLLLPTSVYRSASGSFATNTALNAASALLTPLTVTNILTSQLVPSTAINNLTGDWNTAYNITTAYRTVSSSFVTAVSGTSNQLNASRTGSTVTLSFPSSAIFPGDVSIIGSLTVAGSATYINAQNLVVGDNLIYLNNNNYGSNVLDTGFVSHFTQTPLGYQHTGLVRRAGQGNPGVWTLFSGLTTEPLSASNIDWNDKNIVIDSLSANLIGNVTGNADTVTNGVYTNASYSNPSWITALADTKITGTNRNNWDSAYITATTYQNASGTFATTTALNAASGLLLPTSVYQSTSGTFATSTALNAASGLLLLKTDFSAASATYATKTALTNYLALSGGTLTGALITTSTISSTNTITGNNIATSTQVQFLTGTNFVKVYQFYNSTTNSLDTVFN